MALSHEVISQFAKLVDNKPKKDEGVTVKGTYKIIGDIEYVHQNHLVVHILYHQ